MEESYRYILLVIFTLICQLVFIYLQQRAKNKADLDVKKKLTSIEEGIKTVNALQIDRGKQIFNEEKDSIIVFFAQLNTWIWLYLNVSLKDYESLKSKDIPKGLIELQDAYNKTNVAYAKVKLIINDTNLVEAGFEAICKTYEAHTIREFILTKLCDNNQILNNVRKDIADHKNEKDDSVFDVAALAVGLQQRPYQQHCGARGPNQVCQHGADRQKC